jgi:enoyl-[acyl-carrier protein] reductase I
LPLVQNNDSVPPACHTNDGLPALSGKTPLKSLAWRRKALRITAARTLEEGANVVYVVRSEERRQSVAKLLEGREIHVCDVEFEDQIARLASDLATRGHKFAGLLHSIAFADYEGGLKPFHETPKRAFLRATDVSCYSLLAASNALKNLLEPDASVVTISISTTRMASENYGYMAPIKAALDSSLAFLAKSFSRFSSVRFNAVSPSLLKTSASAGIPGYIDSYLYAEQVIPRVTQRRKPPTSPQPLLSPRSSDHRSEHRRRCGDEHQLLRCGRRAAIHGGRRKRRCKVRRGHGTRCNR